MTDVALQPGCFHIADLDGSPQLQDDLLALEERQTRELIVDGVRGWWERVGGALPEHARMTPTRRTRLALAGRAAGSDRPSRVEQPNDTDDPAAFFRPEAPFALASAEARREAARKLLALSAMGWRSTSRWYGDRDELHER